MCRLFLDPLYDHILILHSAHMQITTFNLVVCPVSYFLGMLASWWFPDFSSSIMNCQNFKLSNTLFFILFFKKKHILTCLSLVFPVKSDNPHQDYQLSSWLCLQLSGIAQDSVVWHTVYCSKRQIIAFPFSFLLIQESFKTVLIILNHCQKFYTPNR